MRRPIKDTLSIIKKRLGYVIYLAAVVLLIPACVLTGETSPAVDAYSGFTVYYIDVGQADSALIVCDGHAMLIDGGNAADSDLIYAFLKERKISYLDYIVATHADEDHVGGLAGALNFATAGTAMCPVTEHESKPFNDFIKYLDRQGVQVTVPKPGDAFTLGGSDVDIFGPVRQYADTNNSSIVMKISYEGTSFLFTGDAEREAERDILEAGYDISSTVLKVGHHGSNTSTTYPFLREITPQYAVISCGDGNPYGHPHEDTLSRLRDADVTVYRTDRQGTITCVSDGHSVNFTTERNTGAAAAASRPPAEIGEGYYIGNLKSRKFHRPGCSGLPSEKNRTLLESREEALNNGYDPCGICNP